MARTESAKSKAARAASIAALSTVEIRDRIETERRRYSYTGGRVAQIAIAREVTALREELSRRESASE